MFQKGPLQQKSNGFSLIELMIVMAIMAVLMSLSGGLMQKSINQQTRLVELEQVTQLFKKLSYQAYYGGGNVQVRLEKNQMQIFYSIDASKVSDEETLIDESDEEDFDNQEIETIDFEQLTFVAQDYNISTKGVVSPNIYRIFGLKDTIELQLRSIFVDKIL